MDPVSTQTPGNGALPDIHFDPPPQHRHSIPTGALIVVGFVIVGVAAFTFINRDVLFVRSTVDLGVASEEKMAAMASVKATAEAEGRPKLSREEKMQFLGVVESGEATSTQSVTGEDSSEPVFEPTPDTFQTTP